MPLIKGGPIPEFLIENNLDHTSLPHEWFETFFTKNTHFIMDLVHQQQGTVGEFLQLRCVISGLHIFYSGRTEEDLGSLHCTRPVSFSIGGYEVSNTE